MTITSTFFPNSPDRGIAFVLDNIADIDQLLAGLPAGMEVHLLDSTGNGLAQMAGILAERSEVAAIHLLSHGSAGKLNLGSIALGSANLSAHANELAVIRSALREDGDLLLYGCDAGAGAKGMAFLGALADATGADIAASADATGAAALGGNWTLEQAVGQVGSAVIAAPSYSGLLAGGTVAPVDGNYQDYGSIFVDGEGNSTDIPGITFEIFFADTNQSPLNTVISFNNGGAEVADIGTVLLPSEGSADKLIIRSQSGAEFKLSSLLVQDVGNLNATYTVLGYKNGGQVASQSFAGVVPQSGSYSATLSFNSGFENVDEVRLTSTGWGGDAKVWEGFTNFVFADPVVPATITSATYDAGTGVLAVTGSLITSGGTIDVSKLTLTGQGGSSVTLSSANVSASSATAFSVTLNAADKLAINGLLNKAGTAAVGGTTYNLAAASGWEVTSSAAADLSGNGVTVSNVSSPSIASAAYDAATNVLTVTGSNLVKTVGSTNDVTVARLTVKGEGGTSYQLTSSNVEVASATGFSVTLNAADQVQVERMFNKNGTASTGGTSYNLAAADDWNSVINNTDISVATAAVTVSNVAVPTITSATYDASTGTLAVTGTGFLTLAGAANDIDAGKFTFTGEGGETYTLSATASVEITSHTAFTLVLAAADRAALSLIVNKNGFESTGLTNYNLSADEDWAAGADAAVAVLDASGNGVLVSNVGAPTITSATYDAASGALVVSGTGLRKLDGTANDIVAGKFTLTGEGGASYTLTDSADVEITSGSAFTLNLSATDRAAVNLIVNKDGTSSTGATTYNLAAAEDWAAGAHAALTTVDASANGITVSNVAAPAITSATYDAATGVLTVAGSGFLSRAGGSNDIVANKFTFTGEGGATHTLTDSGNADITSGSAFTLLLSATDRAALNQIVNKSGTASTGATTYNLAAAEDWAAGADAAVVVADAGGNGVTVSNVAAPAITSAAYNASTGALDVTGTGFAKLAGSANDIVANKFTLTGEGGATHTLSDSASVEITSGTSFTLMLSAGDRAALDNLLNKNGIGSLDATIYNLAAAEDWAAGAAAAVVVADLSGNGITVGNAAGPTITGASYDAATNVLTVSGTRFEANAGAANDVAVSLLTLTGEGGGSHTLTSSDVEISSSSSFAVTLNAADQLAVEGLLNKNGTAADGGTVYNLAAADNWMAAVALGADLTGNAVTVANTQTASITSATYDAATGVLSVTAAGLAQRSGAANDIVAAKFTFSGEGGATWTLTDSANVDIGSGDSFSLTLSATDKAAVDRIVNKNGTAATGGSSYNLAAAEDWAAGAGASALIADLIGNGVMASNVALPAITSATYDGASGTLSVSGSGFTVRAGAANDIVAAKFTLTGEGGATYTLTDTANVEITSGSLFTLTLSATDQAALEAIVNKNGVSAADATTYNLAAAEDWSAGADAALAVADLSGNAITASAVGVPVITSATYDAASGNLAVTGKRFVASDGAANDVVANKFTLSGEGGATYTLTDSANVEITSATGFTLALSAFDQAAVNLLLNKNGSAAPSGASYNLAGAEDWMAGADAATVIADTSGNGITVSNVAAPAITSSSYDAATGVLSVTAAGLAQLAGSANDIVANKFTFSGEGGATYTLTDSANVEIASSTSFSLILSATDKAALNRIVNKNGSASTGGTSYNLAAAEDWSAGADASATIADAANAVTASNVAAPAITAATYNAGTGVLSVSGSNFTSLAGAANDIVAAKFSLTGEGGASYTLTTTANAEIASGTSFTLTLSAADKAAVDLLLNKSGTSANSGAIYNLAAAEDWAAGAHAGVSVADASGNGVTVSIPAPAPDPAPAPVASTVDGVAVQTSTGTDSISGLPTVSVTVPVTTPTRQDDSSTPNPGLADIPLGVGSGANRADLTISLPTGTGLQAEGPSTLLSNSQALLDLIRRIESKTQIGSAVQSEMKGDGASFLSSLAPDVALQTKTLVLSAPSATAGQTILINGDTANEGTAVGLVIDARGLGANTVLQLDHVDFAALVGSATVRGGAGRNYVIGDDARQIIYLGEGDDTLAGGGGNDVVGSAGGNDSIDGGDGDDIAFGGTGNDQLQGGAGADSLQGGASDIGAWRFMLDQQGKVSANFTSTLTGASVIQTLAAGELDATSASLGFVSAGAATLKDLALLYHTAFDRVADLGGLNFWAGQELTAGQLARHFVASGEWQARFGAMSDRDFVTELYKSALGRDPDAAGFAFWTGLLEGKQITRAGVLEGIALSPEHIGHLGTAAGFVLANETVAQAQGWIGASGDDVLAGGAGNDLLVGGDGVDVALFSGNRADYRFLLGEDGSLRVSGTAADGLDTLRQIETARFGDGSVDLGFAGAPLAQLQDVAMLYHTVLGRAADLGGLQFWLGAGQDRMALASGFLNSAEFKQQGALNDQAFVSLMARQAYGAAPTGAIELKWGQYLESHSRAELVAAIVDDAAVVGAQYGVDGLWLV